jgi:hypothetical protein
MGFKKNDVNTVSSGNSEPAFLRNTSEPAFNPEGLGLRRRGTMNVTDLFI